MDTMDRLVAASTEFVCEQWGHGEAALEWYAPVTRERGRVWVHPTYAQKATLDKMRMKATLVWKVSGSFWNPAQFTLVFCAPSRELVWCGEKQTGLLVARDG